MGTENADFSFWFFFCFNDRSWSSIFLEREILESCSSGAESNKYLVNHDHFSIFALLCFTNFCKSAFVANFHDSFNRYSFFQLYFSHISFNI